MSNHLGYLVKILLPFLENLNFKKYVHLQDNSKILEAVNHRKIFQDSDKLQTNFGEIQGSI